MNKAGQIQVVSRDKRQSLEMGGQRRSIVDPDQREASQKAKDEAMHFESLQDKQDSEHPDLGLDDYIDLDSQAKNGQKQGVPVAQNLFEFQEIESQIQNMDEAKENINQRVSELQTKRQDFVGGNLKQNLERQAKLKNEHQKVAHDLKLVQNNHRNQQRSKMAQGKRQNLESTLKSEKSSSKNSLFSGSAKGHSNAPKNSKEQNIQRLSGTNGTQNLMNKLQGSMDENRAGAKTVLDKNMNIPAAAQKVKNTKRDSKMSISQNSNELMLKNRQVKKQRAAIQKQKRPISPEEGKLGPSKPSKAHLLVNDAYTPQYSGASDPDMISPRNHEQNEKIPQLTAEKQFSDTYIDEREDQTSVAQTVKIGSGERNKQIRNFDPSRVNEDHQYQTTTSIKRMGRNYRSNQSQGSQKSSILAEGNKILNRQDGKEESHDLYNKINSNFDEVLKQRANENIANKKRGSFLFQEAFSKSSKNVSQAGYGDKDLNQERTRYEQKKYSEGMILKNAPLNWSGKGDNQERELLLEIDTIHGGIHTPVIGKNSNMLQAQDSIGAASEFMKESDRNYSNNTRGVTKYRNYFENNEKSEKQQRQSFEQRTKAQNLRGFRSNSQNFDEKSDSATEKIKNFGSQNRQERQKRLGMTANLKAQNQDSDSKSKGFASLFGGVVGYFKGDQAQNEEYTAQGRAQDDERLRKMNDPSDQRQTFGKQRSSLLNNKEGQQPVREIRQISAVRNRNNQEQQPAKFTLSSKKKMNRTKSNLDSPLTKAQLQKVKNNEPLAPEVRQKVKIGDFSSQNSQDYILLETQKNEGVKPLSFISFLEKGENSKPINAQSVEAANIQDQDFQSKGNYDQNMKNINQTKEKSPLNQYKEFDEYDLDEAEGRFTKREFDAKMRELKTPNKKFIQSQNQNARAPNQPQRQEQNRSQQNESQQPPEKQTWACSACTFENDNVWRHCQMCETQRDNPINKNKPKLNEILSKKRNASRLRGKHQAVTGYGLDINRPRREKSVDPNLIASQRDKVPLNENYEENMQQNIDSGQQQSLFSYLVSGGKPKDKRPSFLDNRQINDFNPTDQVKGSQTTKFQIKSKSPKGYSGALAFPKSNKGQGINFNNTKKVNRDLSNNRIPEVQLAQPNEKNNRQKILEEADKNQQHRPHKSVNFDQNPHQQIGLLSQDPKDQRSIKQEQSQEPASLLSFFRGIFVPQDSHKNWMDPNKMGPRGCHSADTNATSSQSAINLRKDKSQGGFEGLSPQDAIAQFGDQLTEFEKIELGIYERVYTIGKVRRSNQYQIADREGYYHAEVGEQLGYRYEITKIVDQGAFGQVVRCIDYGDPKRRTIAAKISKNKKFDVDNANVEVRLLQKLKDGLHSPETDGKNRIVQYLDSFKFRQHVVIIFENLHFNLYKFMKVNKNLNPVFQPNQLKHICYQMVQGLNYLKNQKVIHCDLKPENILFTDDEYLNIKLIDFGASCQDCSTGFFYVQSRYYRAPEIVLGIQYDHAVDMWSLGCIVYELITGKPLFPARDENELLEFFILTVGRVPEKMLTQAKKYKQFYNKTNDFFSLYQHSLIRSKESSNGPTIKEGSQPVQSFLNGRASPMLIDFIEKCLIIDPATRMTPSDALLHPWFSQ